MEIGSLQKFCLSLPAVTEDIKWGHDLCFSIGSKMFCVASLEPPLTVVFKVKDEQFEELSSSDGFIPAPYMARAKWVLVNKSSNLSRQQWESYIRQSYDLIKARLTRKIRKELGVD
jgi:predicted DNA-binding protein (MmcQ/YjbR family)